MSNRCNTLVTFYSTNKEQLADLHNRLDALQSEKRGYVSALLEDAGITNFEEENCGDLRSIIIYVSDLDENGEGYSFELDNDDAWGPHIKSWRKAIDKLYPNNDIKMYWIAEEPGCEVFCKYDPMGFYDDFQYYYDACPPNEQESDKYPEVTYDTFPCTLNELQAMFNLKDIKDIMKRAEELNEEFKSLDDGCGYIYIHEYVDDGDDGTDF